MADHVAPALEAILMVAEEPLPPALLAKLVGAPINEVEEICENLAAEYIADGRGFILARVAGGYRFQTATEQAPYVERFVLDGQSARLSAAALETLAVIAYKQPVSRNQIASIRGVNVDAVMRTLQQRGYVDEVARDPGPGQAVLYGTTPTFSSDSGSIRSRISRRSASSSRRLTWSRRSSGDCASDPTTMNSMAPTPSRPTLITVARTSEPPRAAPGGGAAAEDPGPSRVRQPAGL